MERETKRRYPGGGRRSRWDMDFSSRRERCQSLRAGWGSGNVLRWGTNAITGATSYIIRTGITSALPSTFNSITGEAPGATGDSGGAMSYPNLVSRAWRFSRGLTDNSVTYAKIGAPARHRVSMRLRSHDLLRRQTQGPRLPLHRQSHHHALTSPPVSSRSLLPTENSEEPGGRWHPLAGHRYSR